MLKLANTDEKFPRRYLTKTELIREHTEHGRMRCHDHWNPLPLPLPHPQTPLHLLPLHRLPGYNSPRTWRPSGDKRDDPEHGASPDRGVWEISQHPPEEQHRVYLAGRMGRRCLLGNVPSWNVPGSPNLPSGSPGDGGDLPAGCLHLWAAEGRVWTDAEESGGTCTASNEQCSKL